MILQSLDDPSVVGSLLIQAVENSQDCDVTLVDVVSGVMQLLDILLRRAGRYMVRQNSDSIEIRFEIDFTKIFEDLQFLNSVLTNIFWSQIHKRGYHKPQF